jgi:hypothetical protein
VRYYLLSRTAACQLRLHRCLHPAEDRHLAHMAVDEAGKTGSVGVVISDMAEEEVEADTTTDLVVCRRASGEEAKHHQTESPASEEEEAEGMVGTGMDEGGEDGSWT